MWKKLTFKNSLIYKQLFKQLKQLNLTSPHNQSTIKMDTGVYKSVYGY